MKRLFILLICFLLFLVPLNIHADNSAYVQDDAGLLSAEETESLNQKAQELSDQYQFGVYIRTVQDENSYDDIYSCAENYYTENGLGYNGTSDGVLFLIAMSSQGGSYDVYTPGNATVKKISPDGVDMAGNDAEAYLRAHDYDKACEAYLESISDQLSYYTENDTAETYDNRPVSAWIRYLLIFGIPLPVALTVVLLMWKKNRTSHKGITAEQYITKNGVHMNTILDFFLYRTETRQPLPQNQISSDNFTSSSGGSHSGGHF